MKAISVCEQRYINQNELNMETEKVNGHLDLEDESQEGMKKVVSGRTECSAVITCGESENKTVTKDTGDSILEKEILVENNDVLNHTKIGVETNRINSTLDKENLKNDVGEEEVSSPKTRSGEDVDDNTAEINVQNEAGETECNVDSVTNSVEENEITPPDGISKDGEEEVCEIAESANDNSVDLPLVNNSADNSTDYAENNEGEVLEIEEVFGNAENSVSDQEVSEKDAVEKEKEVGVKEADDTNSGLVISEVTGCEAEEECSKGDDGCSAEDALIERELLDVDMADEEDTNEDVLLDDDCNKENEKEASKVGEEFAEGNETVDDVIEVEGEEAEDFQATENQAVEPDEVSCLSNVSEKSKESQENKPEKEDASTVDTLTEQDESTFQDEDKTGDESKTEEVEYLDSEEASVSKDGDEQKEEDVETTEEVGVIGNEEESSQQEGMEMMEVTSDDKDTKAQRVGTRKRSSDGTEEEDGDASRKRRKTVDEEERSKSSMFTDNEEEIISSPCASPALSMSADDSTQTFEDATSRKRSVSPKDMLCSKKPKTFDNNFLLTDDLDNKTLDETSSDSMDKPKRTNLDETIELVATSSKPLPFLESLRGKLRHLTRSDLEELTVQKLCEVISERSTVGELRRRAQALEQDQERWKDKVQAMNKQMREMEMVMKKFMSEVQKQAKEKTAQPVVPLRVTRSVGLQVSFVTNSNKISKPTVVTGTPVVAAPAPPAPVANNNNRPGIKTVLPKYPATVTVQASQLIARPPGTTLTVKAPTPTIPRMTLSPQKTVIIPKKPFTVRPVGVPVVSPNRPIVPQPLMNSNRLSANQVQLNIARPTFKTATPVQQVGSKVIDLTDDDDRQTQKTNVQQSISVRAPANSVRVVNHLQQANNTNRVAYLLPATSTPGAAGSPAQGRQVLIATSTIQTPNRQVVSSMPPLIFKGGSFVPAGSQTTLVNQNSRALLPKTNRHPAPLPQPPLNQLHRPNWKLLPPRPALKISKVNTGIVLSWNMTLGPEYEPIASYQLYAYQEGNLPPTTSLWKKVGDVKALPLPMACTLTQFMTGHKYHFAVRAVDLHSRIGPFSFPGTIVLVK